MIKRIRSSDWADIRKSPPMAEDADLKKAIDFVVKDRVTYVYRHVWTRLKIDGRQISQKLIYREMREEGLLLLRQGQKTLVTKKVKAQWLTKKAIYVGAQMDWNCRATTKRT